MRDSGEGPEENREEGLVPSGKRGRKAKSRRGRARPEAIFEDFEEFSDVEGEEPFSAMDFGEEPAVPAQEPPVVEAPPGFEAEEKPRAERQRRTPERRGGAPRDRVPAAGGTGINFLVPIIIIAAIATLVISILYTHTKEAHWNFIFFLALFILAAQFDLEVKGGGQINLGLAPLLAALLAVVTKPTLPTVSVVWIFLFGTIIEGVVRAISGRFSKDELFGMLVDYVGVGVMAALFHGVVKVLPWKKTVFHGNYTPGLLVAVAVAAAAYFFVQLLHTTFVLSQEGHFPPAVYFSSALRRFWMPYIAVALLGVLSGMIYIAVGMWSVLFVIPLLWVFRYAYNRVAATDEYLLETIRTLSAIPEETGMVTEGHAERVATMAVGVARELGLSPEDVAQIEYAAYLHDIGAVTRQREGEQPQLTEVEGVIAGGVDIVGKVDYLEVAAEVLRGREGLRDRVVDVSKRRAVSAGAGILRAVDDFETLVQGKEGREPLSESDALTEMNLERGVRYDSKVLRAIARSVGRVPKEGYSTSAEGSAEGSSFWGEPEG